MHSIKRLLLAAVLVVTALSLSATAVLAAPANPSPNCMGKDMGASAREYGSGWGGLVSGEARSGAPFGGFFGETNWGQAMVLHLAGAYYGEDGVTCQ